MIIIYSFDNIHAQANNLPLLHPPRSLHRENRQQIGRVAAHPLIHKAFPLANFRHNRGSIFLGPHARALDRQAPRPKRSNRHHNRCKHLRDVQIRIIRQRVHVILISSAYYI